MTTISYPLTSWEYTETEKLCVFYDKGAYKFKFHNETSGKIRDIASKNIQGWIHPENITKDVACSAFYKQLKPVSFNSKVLFALIERWILTPKTLEEVRVILFVNDRIPRLAVESGHSCCYIDKIEGLPEDLFSSIRGKINHNTLERFKALNEVAITDLDVKNKTIKFVAINLIYIKCNEEYFSIHVNLKDAISEIKNNIPFENAECLDHNHAFHRDRQLSDDRTLQEEGIGYGSLIWWGYKICVYPPDSTSRFSLDVSCKSSIGQLKNRIEPITKIPRSEQSLSCGIPLNEDNKTLHSFEIKESSSLNLHARLKGGGPQKYRSLNYDMQNRPVSNDKVEFSLSLTGAKWKKITRGFNLKGICENANCKAHLKKVWMNFQLSDNVLTQKDLMHKAICPCCNEPIKKLINAGFYNCEYSIKAAFENDGKKMEILEESKTAHNKLRLVLSDDATSDEDFCDYQFIKIKAQKRGLSLWQHFKW